MDDERYTGFDLLTVWALLGVLSVWFWAIVFLVVANLLGWR